MKNEFNETDQDKSPYCKITWHNCELEYGHSICEFDNVKHEIDAVEEIFNYEMWLLDNPLPSFTVELIYLTKEEFLEETANYE